jgi:hypothetical protein
MKIFSTPLSWIYLLIPGLIFLLSFLISSMPGALLGFYLIGIVFCIPSTSYSTGWVRWTAIGLILFFVVASYAEHQSGLRYARFMGEKTAEYKLKNH